MHEQFCAAGIDGGGSKTECAIVDNTGKCLGIGYGGPTNPNYSDLEDICEAVKTACIEALNKTGDNHPEIRDIGCDMIPMNDPCVKKTVTEIFKCENVKLYGEGRVALACIDAFDGFGVACIAGTGSTTFGCAPDGRSAAHGGWGIPLGDDGSAGDIALKGIHAAGLSFEKRGVKTVLEESAVKFFAPDFSLNRIFAFGKGIFSRRSEIAGFSKEVSKAAYEGDSVALGIIEGAAQDLSVLALSVIRELYKPDDSFPVALHGGVYSDKRILSTVKTSILSEFPSAKVMKSIHTPGVAAALLTLHDYGDDIVGKG